MNGDTYSFPGGLYDLDQKARTDVTVQESGPGIGEGDGIPLSLCLNIITGAASITVVEITPKALMELGKWLSSVGKDILARERRMAAQPTE